MLKHIVGQTLYQILILLIFIFAGDKFLVDPIGKRQLQPNSNLIVNGFEVYGYDKDNYGGAYSVHATYNFNVFVIMQIFNFFNARVLNDKKNIFDNFTKAKFLHVMLIIIISIQVLILTFCGSTLKIV